MELRNYGNCKRYCLTLTDTIIFDLVGKNNGVKCKLIRLKEEVEMKKFVSNIGQRAAVNDPILLLLLLLATTAKELS